MSSSSSGHKWPAQAGAAGSVQVLADRALGQAETAGNGAPRHADAVVQA